MPPGHYCIHGMPQSARRPSGLPGYMVDNRRSSMAILSSGVRRPLLLLLYIVYMQCLCYCARPSACLVAIGANKATVLAI